MTTDPQPIPTPEGYGWYWPQDLNDDEFETIGRHADPHDSSHPCCYSNADGPVLARRKPPEPWVPKAGDRVREGGGVWTGTVKAVEGLACWVLYDDAAIPTTVHVAKLSPPPKADQ